MPCLPTMVDASAPTVEPCWRATYPSLPETKDRVVWEILSAVDAKGWLGDDDRAWLQLCLDEAVVNAMVHGNEADDTAQVTVTLSQQEDRWRLQIDDQGTGFDLRDVPDPDGDDVLTREHGRGIRLLREWLDRVAYYRHGATLVMERRIDPR